MRNVYINQAARWVVPKSVLNLISSSEDVDQIIVLLKVKRFCYKYRRYVGSTNGLAYSSFFVAQKQIGS
jgi:hypothetical protein